MKSILTTSVWWVFCLSAMLLIGCGDDQKLKVAGRFITQQQNDNSDPGPGIWLIKDTLTEAEYLVARTGSGTAIIQLRK